MSEAIEKVVEIKVRGADLLPLERLSEFQGNLKSLSKDSYEKLKKIILRHGFSEPISVWKDGSKYHVLNGHQRLMVLKGLKAEGYLVPSVPVSWVEARDKKEAKEKVLALTSQYGEMTDAGLSDFMIEAGLDFSFLDEHLRFPEVDFGIFNKDSASESLHGEWDGVPESDLGDEKPFHSLILKFRDEEGLRRFSEAIGVNASVDTASLWFEGY